MKEKLRYTILQIFSIILILSINTIGTNAVMESDLDTNNLNFIKKVSKAYTNKFCNSVAFGLSKESAMNFSIGENNKVYSKKKEMKSINKEFLAEEIATSVVEECGYKIDLSGEKGIQEFKIYYLSKDKDL